MSEGEIELEAADIGFDADASEFAPLVSMTTELPTTRAAKTNAAHIALTMTTVGFLVMIVTHLVSSIFDLQHVDIVDADSWCTIALTFLSVILLIQSASITIAPCYDIAVYVYAFALAASLIIGTQSMFVRSRIWFYMLMVLFGWLTFIALVVTRTNLVWAKRSPKDIDVRASPSAIFIALVSAASLVVLGVVFIAVESTAVSVGEFVSITVAVSFAFSALVQLLTMTEHVATTDRSRNPETKNTRYGLRMLRFWVILYSILTVISVTIALLIVTISHVLPALPFIVTMSLVTLTLVSAILTTRTVGNR